MDAAIEVIGETVVATRGRVSWALVSEFDEQAVRDAIRASAIRLPRVFLTFKV
jgi:hypothetical protein